MTGDPLKVSAALADPTRYAIYQHVLQAPQEAVTVQEVADHFSIHPNVARMHLARLVDVGLLTARPARSTSRGGRPAAAYAASDEAVALTVPARDYALLSHLLSDAIALVGEAGLEALTRVGQQHGRHIALEALAAAGLEPGTGPTRAALEACAQALSMHGLDVGVTAGEDGSADLHLKLHRCGFREVALRNAHHICHLCHAMVQGVTEVIYPAARVQAGASIPHGDRHCVYHVPVIPADSVGEPMFPGTAGADPE